MSTISNAPCACSEFLVQNYDIFGVGPRVFTYVDCDGNTQSLSLLPGDFIQVCGCASSFSCDDNSGEIGTNPPVYDICPLGTIGFDDRYVSIYGNYTVRSLRNDTYFPFSYINYNGDTVNDSLQPEAILELTGVLVGSLLSLSTAWLVSYQGEYIPN